MLYLLPLIGSGSTYTFYHWLVLVLYLLPLIGSGSTYSVMQSDGNRFCGVVVLNSFKKASRDEDNILDKVYKSKYVRISIMIILILYNIIRKCKLTQQ